MQRSRVSRWLPIAGLALLCGCAAVPPASTTDPQPFALRTAQAPLPMPRNTPPELEFSTAEALLPQVEALYPDLGRWPPAYTSAAERQRLYARWTRLLNVARVLEAQEQQSEPSRYVLAELYRLGHNLGVAEAGVEAQRVFEACIAAYTHTIACHFSAIRYYLMVTPLQLERAERSLGALRGQLSPEFNEEVERGYVFLYTLRDDRVAAARQIQDYLALFPQSAHAAGFRQLLERLRNGEDVVVSQPQ